MVIESRKDVELNAIEHSRSGREAALERAQAEALRSVLASAEEDVDIRQEEDETNIRISARLITLNKGEFAALAELFRAHDKGYSAAVLLPLVGELAKVFRR